MKMYARLFAVLLAAFSANAENLLTNPGLETHPADNWDWTGMGWSAWGGGHTDWSAHSGGQGMFMPGWETNWGASVNGGLFQDVVSTGGVYTFSIWARREERFLPTVLECKLEWKDASFGDLGQVSSNYLTLPGDGLWHHIFVTASNTAANIAYVRSTIYVVWNTVSNGLALTLDDAELYLGSYTGCTPVLQNPSFEMCSQSDGWRGSYWGAQPDAVGRVSDGYVNWAARLGGHGAIMRGWNTGQPTYTTRFSQAISPGTGTYTFAIWMKNLTNFHAYTTQVQIAWFDRTYTNQLGAAATTFMVPHDNSWHEYYVTTEITNTDVFEVRPSVYAGWYENTTDQNDRALMVDDARFYTGSYKAWHPSGLDYIYFNNPATAQPELENVPDLGVPFLSYSYESNVQSYLHVMAPKGALSAMRSRFWFAGAGEIWRDGAWFTNIVIETANKFHGDPSGSDMTMDVWRVSFYPPANWVGDMYYSPAVTLAGDGVEWFCASNLDGVADGFVATNNWSTDPQRFWSLTPINHDWKFVPTGRINRAGVTLDWAYYNHTNWNPATEIIPSFDGTSTFLRVNYATTSTTFYVIAEKPLKVLLPGENSYILMRTSWEVPPAGSGIWSNEWRAMSWVSNLVLNAATNFHGLPATGSHTVDLWRLDWPQPMTNGVLVTNAVTVYYAPLLKVVYGPLEYIEDERYLVKRIEGVTNGWGFNSYSPGPQYYGRVPTDDHDWLYINNPFSGLTDGIPDTWWALYGITGGDRVAADDYDGDHYSNLEEYAGNTDPTLDTSYFPRASTVDGVRTVMYLIVNPTSSERAYDAWWKTNLLDPSAWQPYGLSVPGNGSSITLTVTNEVNKRFYRTGAKLP